MLISVLTFVSWGGSLGHATYEGVRFEFSEQAAAMRPNEFDPNETELAVIVSDWPLTDEDVADGLIEHDLSRLDFVFRNGKIWRVSFMRGISETSFGDGLKFEGTVGKRIKGRIFTEGEVDIMGSMVGIDVQVDVAVSSAKDLDARVVARGKDAEKSEWAQSLKALAGAIQAEQADVVKANLSQDWVRAIDEEMYGQVSMLAYSLDIPEQYQVEKVSVNGENARLYLKTEDRLGVARFIKQGGAWKCDGVSWKYTW